LIELVVFARRPVPGRVKTRLTPPLTPEEACAVYEACLHDTIDRAVAAAGSLRIAYDDAHGSREYFERTFPGTLLTPQSAGDLGARLEAIFVQRFAAGAQGVAIIGTDSPTLPPERIAEGLKTVRSVDVVLGPAEDGGYYLIAVRVEAWPRTRTLFDGISWSSGTVLDETIDRITQAKLSLALLASWYDIDDWAGLQRAKREADPDSRLGRHCVIAR
jgi:uncharacterized protein